MASPPTALPRGLISPPPATGSSHSALGTASGGDVGERMGLCPGKQELLRSTS